MHYFTFYLKSYQLRPDTTRRGRKRQLQPFLCQPSFSFSLSLRGPKSCSSVMARVISTTNGSLLRAVGWKKSLVSHGAITQGRMVSILSVGVRRCTRANFYDDEATIRRYLVFSFNSVFVLYMAVCRYSDGNTGTRNLSAEPHFSVSHDHLTLRIYCHCPIIDGKNTNFSGWLGGE